MKSADPNRMTRVQVQEKLKKNFQALCARCPQLANDYDVLDDSLTSLHWLSNLNVNISNPTKDNVKDAGQQRNQSIFPPFPRNQGKNGVHNPGAQHFPSGEISYARRNWNFQPGGNKQRNRKTSAKIGRNSSSAAPAIGRPTPPPVPSDSGPRMHSASIASSKMLVKGFPLNSPVSHPLYNVNNTEIREPAVGWMNDVINARPDGAHEANRTQPAVLPQIQTVLNGPQLAHPVIEPPVSSASPATQYSFSPREVMLDIMPGQVDYRNNPYVKPTFSYTTLICMALQNSKKHKMSFTAICKWIADNFMYYRYAESGWQGLVKHNLTQNKFFKKVQKKESSSKSYLWEINPEYNIKLQDSASSLLFGNLRKTDPRLEPVQISPASSWSLPSVPIFPKFDSDEAPPFSNRKRKQTTPQKSVRRWNSNAKKRRNNSKANKNLLQEEAPELGSLKGDFNWNTIFDEVFGSTEAALSVTPTSLASRPSTNEGADSRDTTGQLTDDVAAGTLLALDMLSLPDLPEPGSNDENHEKSGSVEKAENGKKVENGLRFHEESKQEKTEKSTNKISADLCRVEDLPVLEDCNFLFPDSSTESDFESINGFLKNVDDLDLTITGTQIAPPPEWVPVSPELETILCETQNDEIYEHPAPLDIDSLLSGASSSSTPNTDQYLSSTTNAKKGRKQKPKKNEIKRPQNTWQRSCIATAH